MKRLPFISMITVVVLTALLVGCVAPVAPQSGQAEASQETTQSIGGCVGFEELVLGETYHVGDVFTDSGVQITATDFQWGNGTPTSGGYAEVGDSGMAGGSGQEVQINNILLNFDFGGPIPRLTLRFGEYGGNLNIEVNGEFRNFEDFAELNGQLIGGVNVMVVNGFGNDQGTLTLEGVIDTFALGGQELWIDDLCLNSSGFAVGCVGFEELVLGETYHVGDVFTDSGVQIAATDFQWGNGTPTSGGYAEVGDSGMAGGSGQEVQINNILLNFDFGGSIPRLTLRFGEYGGNLNIEINGEFRNFEDFAELNGQVIGGVNVMVVNGLGNDQGTLTLEGVIDTFALGGQELWIDDLCPLP